MKPTPRFGDSSERPSRNEAFTTVTDILLAIAIFIVTLALLHLAMVMLG